MWPGPEETVEHQTCNYSVTQPHGSSAVGEVNAWFPVGKAVEWHVNVTASLHMIYTWSFDNKKWIVGEVGCS